MGIMSKRRTSWKEKLENNKGYPQVCPIDGKKSKRWGTGTFVIPAPREESAEAYIRRFTRRVLRLDGELWGSVAMAVAEGRWKDADNPIAYVSRVAQREHLRAEGWLDPSRSSDVYAHEIPHSLDWTATVTGDPLGALIEERSNPFAEAEFMLDFDLAVHRSALSPGAQLVGHVTFD